MIYSFVLSKVEKHNVRKKFNQIKLHAERVHQFTKQF